MPPALTDEEYARIMESRKRAWQNKEGSFRSRPDEGGSDSDESGTPPEPVPEHVAALKEKADAAYNDKRFQEAVDVRRALRLCPRLAVADSLGCVQAYSEAVSQVETAKRGPQRELLMKLWLNRAACLLPLGEFEKCEADCTAVLQKFDPSEPKARYRRALARRQQGKLFMAMSDLEVAKKRTKKGTPKAERIQQVIERLQDDMGVPGMCFTQKEILRGVPEPEPGEPPLIAVARGDTVTCHVTAYVQAGHRLFWTTRSKKKDEHGDTIEGKPFTYVAGRGRVIRGWDMGVLGMHVGEVRSLMIPAKEAYGEKGYPEWEIPPNADLLYDIEVVKIEPKPPLRDAVLKWCGGPYMLCAILMMVASVLYTFFSDGRRISKMYHGD